MKNPGFWQHILHTPLVLPILFLAGAYLLSTLLSVIPGISLWGSYNRLQGTFTFFSYLVLFFSTLGMMRKEEQLNRLWIMIILTSLPVSFYGLLQHFRLDPIPWGREGSECSFEGRFHPGESNLFWGLSHHGAAHHPGSNY